MATKLQRSNFSVEPYLPGALGGLQPAAAAACDTILGLRKLANFYYGFAADLAPVDLARDVISGLGVTIKTNPEELASVPTEGPCIVVANHPHGMLDGLLVVGEASGVKHRTDKHMVRPVIQIEKAVGADSAQRAEALDAVWAQEPCKPVRGWQGDERLVKACEGRFARHARTTA